MKEGPDGMLPYVISLDVEGAMEALKGAAFAALDACAAAGIACQPAEPPLHGRFTDADDFIVAARFETSRDGRFAVEVVIPRGQWAWKD